jgi:hypothetical protein
MSIRHASFGEVSSGTLRSEDLLSAFSAELDYQLKRQVSRFPRAAHRKLIRDAEKMLETMEDAEHEPDGASDLVAELEDALCGFAPPYGYFGAAEGDGACFGFWLNDFMDGFDGLRVADTSEVPKGYRGEVLHVNDHGNVTLYVSNGRGTLREVWGCV